MSRAEPGRTRVAIADDHRILCGCFVELLRVHPRIEVVAQAHDGLAAEKLFARSDIDVVLLDLQLPERHGLEVLKRVKGGPAVCVLTMHTDQHFVSASMQAGALGYISKDAAPNELVEGILAVARGEVFFSKDVCQVALALRARGINERLTGREQEVLRLCALGQGSAEIAGQLGISRRTAEGHRAHLMKKLSVKSQSEVVRYALRHGIIGM